MIAVSSDLRSGYRAIARLRLIFSTAADAAPGHARRSAAVLKMMGCPVTPPGAGQRPGCRRGLQVISRRKGSQGGGGSRKDRAMARAADPAAPRLQATCKVRILPAPGCGMRSPS
jgi:hypothetical protein